MAEILQTWPRELDALVAAPKHHRLVLEDDRVRVLETRIEPGEIVPMHTHCWPSVNYVLSWSDFVRRDVNGNVVLDSRETKSTVSAGQAIWSAPFPLHTLENVGDAPIHLISVEMKPQS